MKNIAYFILVSAIICTLSACSSGEIQPTTPTDTQPPEGESVLTGKVVWVYENGGILLACEDGTDLVSVPLPENNDMEVTTGQILYITYSGGLMESYPAQISEVLSLKASQQGEDFVGLYLRAITDLWEEDKGLNDAVSLLAFDLTSVSNLTAAEKNALLYLVEMELGIETVPGTFESLSQQGEIDSEALYFERGLLFEIQLLDEGKSSIQFSASKWRSGLGAYYYSDCTAEESENGWEYTVNAQAIS